MAEAAVASCLSPAVPCGRCTLPKPERLSPRNPPHRQGRLPPPRPEPLRRGEGPHRLDVHHVAHLLQAPAAVALDQERLILSAVHVHVPGDGVPVIESDLLPVRVIPEERVPPARAVAARERRRNPRLRTLVAPQPGTRSDGERRPET